jgi:hypothetical protein
MPEYPPFFKLTVAGSLSVIDTFAGNNSTVTNLTANNSVITNLTAVNAIIDNYNFDLKNITSQSYIFLSSDNSKNFHFNTSVNPITGIFPNSLPNGFNVSIINIGTGTVFISSQQQPFIKALGTFNETQYSGMLIYKHNNELFGVGVFE